MAIFSINYSRRIDRQRMNTLNPFRIYVNLYNSYAGNPYLRPTISNNLEFNYLLNEMISFTIFALQTKK
ncbi:outer membrane beta-barrel protein [Sphingobacterium paludis]|uniref:Outer membrane beta-barrel protein n=1 Tax=Sphingobacterium paludis TaxID=1476465 RepID=A0A4R7CY27_9SPHI|nr:outer membrane beta-barrel protein [Sphingobacterium paludis]